MSSPRRSWRARRRSPRPSGVRSLRHRGQCRLLPGRYSGATRRGKAGSANRDVHRVEDPLAEYKRRLAALPGGAASARHPRFPVSTGQPRSRWKNAMTSLDSRHQWRESLPVARQVAKGARTVRPPVDGNGRQTHSPRQPARDLGDLPAAQSATSRRWRFNARSSAKSTTTPRTGFP